MMRKLTLILVSGIICLLGVTSALANWATLEDYEKATGKKIVKFNEAPMLRQMVAAGQLPPVEERLPEEPMVVEPVDRVGQYGGSLVTGALGPSIDIDTMCTQYQFMCSIESDLSTIYPNILKDFSFSEDKKTLTLYLRKGMKWSDGAPFTADDFLFWYEDITLNDELTSVLPYDWSPGGELAKFTKTDDYTVRIQFSVPYPVIIGKMTNDRIPYAPKHYLKKWHINYNSKADEVAKEEGFDRWQDCFNYHMRHDWVYPEDFNCPVLDPWIPKKKSPTQVIFERNPYYWKVDTEGNQLPYIDREIQMIVSDYEVLKLKGMSGEFTHMAAGGIGEYPLYKESEKKGGYRTMLWKGGNGAEEAIGFNLTYNEDPVLRKIFNDIRFRQAMSLALDRDEINDLFYFGKAVPRQAAVLPNASFYEDWMGKYYADYNLEEANKLLDEMGLKWDKKHEYRLRPDGKPLSIILDFITWEQRGKKLEVIKQQWRKVGVDLILKSLERNLFQQRGSANRHQAIAWTYDFSTEIGMYLSPSRLYPPWGSVDFSIGIPWTTWNDTNGEEGEEPPEDVKRLFELVEKWKTTIPGTKEYVEIGKELMTINVKNLFLIGTVGMSPGTIIVKNNLGNTPIDGSMIPDYVFWMPYQADQWFYK